MNYLLDKIVSFGTVISIFLSRSQKKRHLEQTAVQNLYRAIQETHILIQKLSTEVRIPHFGLLETRILYAL